MTILIFCKGSLIRKATFTFPQTVDHLANRIRELPGYDVEII